MDKINNNHCCIPDREGIKKFSNVFHSPYPSLSYNNFRLTNEEKGNLGEYASYMGFSYGNNVLIRNVSTTSRTEI